MIALAGKALGVLLAAVLATQAPSVLTPPRQHEPWPGSTTGTSAPTAPAAATATAPATAPATSPPTAPATSPDRPQPLAGVVVALDPGHQLGNGRFPRQTGRIVAAGRGLRKPCNTTGTAIPGGLPEATVAWRVVQAARVQLEALGAVVRLTRATNSAERWGPCVSTRGRFGGRVGARLMVSVHVDGSLDTRAHGFHVIEPSSGHLLHPAVRRPSRRLALAVRGGFDAHGIPRSTYVGAGTALSPRNDLGTLNLSSVPVVMIELGNSHHRGDARRMSTAAGRRTYAAAVVAGVRGFLDR
ncbi:MAG: N-acetylmuramoyl-L-alanine amidase family protein [Marmoricola sp.]